MRGEPCGGSLAELREEVWGTEQFLQTELLMWWLKDRWFYSRRQDAVIWADWEEGLTLTDKAEMHHSSDARPHRAIWRLAVDETPPTSNNVHAAMLFFVFFPQIIWRALHECYLMSLLIHRESCTVDVKAWQCRGRGLAFNLSLKPNIGLYVFISRFKGWLNPLTETWRSSLLLLNFWAVQKKTQIDERQGGTPHDTPLCVNLSVLCVCVCCLSYLESLSWPTICAWDKAERWNCNC